nr:hypothetical protein CFP56_45554 [Quercus suber]
MIQKKREKGEIVWVRVSLSQTCWPALVLRAFQDSVLVSFFSLPQFPPSRYVLDSLLLSFPDNFRSLAPSAPHALLHRALRLYGLKSLSSLTCPCQGKTTPRRRFENNAATATAKTAPFKKAEDVLGFVFSAAVSPWVEKAGFVEAVESMAFVHAFRGYKSAKLRGNKNKNSAAHESDILGLEDEFQLLSQELEKNLEAGVTNGMSSKVPFLTESFNPLHEHQLSHTRLQQSKEQSVNEVLVSLHCLSLDPFYLVGKCLKTVEHNVLRFRSLSFQNISDFCFKKCLHPKSPETHFSDPGYTKTESGVKVHKTMKFSSDATAKTAPFKRAEDVLGFVFSAAVLPWVEKAEFVEAVEAKAFVHAFRGYKSAKLRGNKNKNSIAHESDILELEDEFQLLSQELEKNLEAGVTNGMSSKVPFLTESYNPLHEHQLSHTQLKQSKEQSVNEVLVSLHCLALDPFYLVGKCLKTVEHNVLRFRSLSFQNNSDFCFKKCLHPKSPETHFSDPGYTKTESGVKVDRKQSSGEIFCPFLSYMAAPVNSLGLKRKLDQPSNSYRSLKVHKTMQFSLDAGTSAYLQKNKAGHKENSTLFDPSFKLCMTMPLFSLNGSDSYLSRKHSSGFQVELINALFPSSPAKLKMRHHSSTKPQRLTYLCNNNLMVSVQNKFNISLPGGASHCGEVEISKLQESAENFDSLNDTRASISSVDCILAAQKFPSQSDFTADKIKMLPCDIDDATSIRSDKEASINVAFGDSSKENKELYQPVTSDSSFKLQRGQLEAFDTIAYSLHLKFPKDFELPSKQELVEKFSPFGIVDSLRTKIFSYISAAKVVFLHPTDAVAAYQYANKERVLFGKANIRVWLDPLGQKRIGTEFSAPSPLLTGKPVSPKRCQHVTSDSSFKSQRDQQLEALDTTASTSLHMKFPKDFKLPSKQELVKKFSRFGTVDSSKTKVFSCTGAAQVVFLHPTDAVAAYHYAKKKRVVFGEANVRFWLDPLDHKRRGTKFSAPPPLLTGKPVNLKRHQHVTTDSSYKSQRGQQLEELATTAASTSLHMKFPKDFKLPSTQEVVKKFSRFGTVDSFRTNVSSCTGAAQVVFLQPTDAVAAYKYAKKKRVMFGVANVRFWLDPLDHKRRGTKFSVSPPSLTETQMNLKSCLRKSSPLECRDKKKPHKVRFLMVT